MGKFLRLFIRITTAVKNPLQFSRIHPKKLEAIGLSVVLLSGFFQIQSDGYQRWLLLHQIEESRGESEYTRQKIMSLIECENHGKCREWDREIGRPEIFTFIPNDIQNRIKFWQFVRNFAFIFGSILILASKWMEGRPLKAITHHRYRNISTKYRKIIISANKLCQSSRTGRNV